MSTAAQHPPSPTLFGHPTGLFVLFFAEMWERFSYYGMRALLTFYMIKGFLGYNDREAYGVYGAYTALVYATPFIGGMLADRLLGARRAVIIGGILMAAGHLLMTVEQDVAFFTALALLIVGNGFFKPNISTIVGTLYPEESKNRDGGFTLFYMGINLGAAMSPLLCGYIGETYGWHYGFGMATLGMLVGLAVFVAPIRITQAFVVTGAVGAAAVMVWLGWGNFYLLAVNVFVSVALLTAAAVGFVALQRGGIPDWAGQPPEPAKLRAPMPFLGIPSEFAVYGGIVLAVPVLALLVQRETVATWIMSIAGAVALVYLLWEAFRSVAVERDRMIVALVLMVFSMLFWAFFEQAGSSVNVFTDRNVDRVMEERVVSADEVGTSLSMALTQEQLGFSMGEQVMVLPYIDKVRENGASGVEWPVSGDDVGMGVAQASAEIPASTFQAANPVYILVFGLGFTALWGFLAARGWEPSTPVKFALGLIQLGLGFGAFWYGATLADERGMVSVLWLLLGYLLQTTGELCLSPVGLSMIVKLSPVRLVSSMMGAWFFATAFSNILAGGIAKLTGVGEHAGGDASVGEGPAFLLGDRPSRWRVDSEVAVPDGTTAPDVEITAEITLDEGDDPGTVTAQWIRGTTILVVAQATSGIDGALPITVRGPYANCAEPCAEGLVLRVEREGSGVMAGHFTVKTTPLGPIPTVPGWEAPEKPVTTEVVWNPPETLALYRPVFGVIGLVAIASGLFCLLISPLLRRGMHEDHEESDAERTARKAVGGH